MRISKLLRVIPGIPVLLFLLHWNGAGMDTFALAFLFFAAACYEGDRVSGVSMAALLVLAVLQPSPSQRVAVVTAAASWNVWASSSLLSRVFSLAALAFCIASGGVTSLEFMTLAALASLPFRERKWRTLALGLGMTATVAILGLPQPVCRSRLYAAERMEDDGTVWRCDSPLTLATPELLLDASPPEYGKLTMWCDAGGTRTDAPVALVISGRDTAYVYPGSNTVEISDPAFPVFLRLADSWKPMNHQVVHFLGAKVIDGRHP